MSLHAPAMQARTKTRDASATAAERWRGGHNGDGVSAFGVGVFCQPDPPLPTKIVRWWGCTCGACGRGLCPLVRLGCLGCLSKSDTVFEGTALLLLYKFQQRIVYCWSKTSKFDVLLLLYMYSVYSVLFHARTQHFCFFCFICRVFFFEKFPGYESRASLVCGHLSA